MSFHGEQGLDIYHKCFSVLKPNPVGLVFQQYPAHMSLGPSPNELYDME